MSLPPPARASGSVPSPTTASITPGQPFVRASSLEKASALPLVVAAASVALGLGTRLIPPDLWTEILGYVLAGFIPIMCLGWDSVSQRRGLANPNFIPKRAYTLVIRILAGVGIIIAVINLTELAIFLAEKWSEL